MVSAQPTNSIHDDTPILTISELNATARLLLEERFQLVWLQGEISNLRIPASGHWYFTLKDERAQVRCVLFRGRNRLARLQPKDGLVVRMQGSVSLYEERGEFQVIGERIEPAGDGALRLAFEALKRRLAAEGLFAEERKRPLPTAAVHLALITSPSGAAVRDMLRVIGERCPLLRVTLLPVAVQGEAAPTGIIAALNTIAALHALVPVPAVDVVILGRGGGAAEDLSCFNDEGVARAIAACPVPVVSAVGHETDVTLADFVADVRAATPSTAAALVAPDLSLWRDAFATYESGLGRLVQTQLRQVANELTAWRARLRHPGARLADVAQALDDREQRLIRALQTQHDKLDAVLTALRGRLRSPLPGIATLHTDIGDLGARLRRGSAAHIGQSLTDVARTGKDLRNAVERLIEGARATLQSEARALDAVSPLATLERGYSVLLGAVSGDGKRALSAQDLKAGDRIAALLRDGLLDCVIEEVAVGPPAQLLAMRK